MAEDNFTERDVFSVLLPRRENYEIDHIQRVAGNRYSLLMKGRMYNTVVVTKSFDFYERGYHLGRHIPELVVCFYHDTVLAVPCLALQFGEIYNAFGFPVKRDGRRIKDIEQERYRSKTGSQILLGMYLCGMKEAQKIINTLAPSTQKRYMARARDLCKKRGRPPSV